MKKLSILYILTQFPVLSEVFVLNEITELIDLGYDVNIVSIKTPQAQKVHDNVKKYNLLEKASYLTCITYPKATLLKKVVIALLTDRTLNMQDKFRLLVLCDDKVSRKGLVLKYFLACLTLLNVLKNKNIEHIHCHFADRNVKLAYIIRQFSSIPYTFTTHAYDIFVQPHKDLKKWATHAKKVITISEFNTQYMHQTFNIPLEKIAIVPCSKYVEKLEPVQEYRLSPFRIISVSRLVEKKGYPYLIQACKTLHERGIQFSCIIHGDGDEKSALEQLIKEYDLDHVVTLEGALLHDEVIQFIKTGSVFVLPCIQARNNDMDGMPNVLMEAMAMEIPVISTDVTGIPELIEHGTSGMIVPQEDPFALAEAIMKIKQEHEFTDKIRKRGRERVLQKFDVHVNVKKLVKIIEE